MASEDGSALFVPEKDAIGETLPQNARYVNITRRWLLWVREVSRLLQRFNATGVQNGVVVTDDTGTATVSRNDMEDFFFVATDFTADAGAWVVEVDDAVSFARNTLGRMMVFAFELVGTTVTATPTELRIAIPGGIVSQRQISNLVYLNDNGTPAVGLATAQDSGTTVVITRLDGAAFATSADATDVRGELLMEIE